MFDTLTVIAYLLGNDSGLTSRMRLHASFLNTQNQVCVQNAKSPELKWSGIPPEASSLALIIKDEKPQKMLSGIQYYWITYNLPVDTKGLPDSSNDYINHNNEGVNSWGQKNYHMPCFTHKAYPIVIELYALDKRIQTHKIMTGNKIEQKIKGHVLAKTRIVIKI